MFITRQLCYTAAKSVYFGASEILPRIHVSDANAIHTVNVPGLIDQHIG